MAPVLSVGQTALVSFHLLTYILPGTGSHASLHVITVHLYFV